MQTKILQEIHATFIVPIQNIYSNTQSKGKSSMAKLTMKANRTYGPTGARFTKAYDVTIQR